MTLANILSCLLNATASSVEMADGLRSEGKIFVVVLVISIIISGLFAYLFYLDRKIRSRE